MFKKIQQLLAGRSPKERMGIMIAALAVLLALSDRVFLRPVTHKLNQLDEGIRTQEVLIQKNTRILSQKEGLREKFEQYASFIIETRSEEEEVAAFLKEVESFASKSSVYVIDIKSRSTVTDGPVAIKYIVDLNCEGQMEQIVKFMYLVEQSDSLLKVAKYNLIPRSKESSILKATLSIHKLRSQPQEIIEA